MHVHVQHRDLKIFHTTAAAVLVVTEYVHNMHIHKQSYFIYVYGFLSVVATHKQTYHTDK